MARVVLVEPAGIVGIALDGMLTDIKVLLRTATVFAADFVAPSQTCVGTKPEPSLIFVEETKPVPCNSTTVE